MSKVSFELSLQEQPVELKSNDKVKHCIIRELDGKHHKQYMERMAANVEIGEDGKVAKILTAGVVGLEGFLLSLCLYDESGNLLPTDEIDAFPYTVQKELFKIAQKLSGLDKDAEAEAKNASEVESEIGSD